MGAESSIPQQAADDRASTPPLSPLLAPQVFDEHAQTPSTMTDPPVGATEMLDGLLFSSTQPDPNLKPRKKSKKRRSEGKTKGSNHNAEPYADGEPESRTQVLSLTGGHESTGPEKKRKKEKKKRKKKSAKVDIAESPNSGIDSSRKPEAAVRLDGFSPAFSQADNDASRTNAPANLAASRKQRKRGEAKATRELVDPVQDVLRISEGVVIPSSPKPKTRYPDTDNHEPHKRHKPSKDLRNQEFHPVDAAEGVQPTTSFDGSDCEDIVQDTQEMNTLVLDSGRKQSGQEERAAKPRAEFDTLNPSPEPQPEEPGFNDVSGPPGDEIETDLDDAIKPTGVLDGINSFIETPPSDDERSSSVSNVGKTDILGSRQPSGGVGMVDAVVARQSMPEQPLAARGYDGAVISSTPHPSTNRSHNKRLPKPSFYDRGSEDDAQDVPTPDLAKELKSVSSTGRKRRLSLEVFGNVESSYASKKERSGEVAKEARTKKSRTSNTTVQNAADSGDGVLTIENEHRQGPLTQLEIEQITQAVEQFRLDQRLQKNEINDLIQENPKGGKPIHLGLWRRIQSACPSRSRRKLIQWSRRHFHNFTARGTWTEEQDRELRELVKIHGKQWSLIGGIISRHPTDARDRWRNYLVCCDRKINVWSGEEEEKLLDIVSASLLAIRSTREADRNDKSLEPDEKMLDWGYISEKMGFTRTRLQCQYKWNHLRRTREMDKRFSVALQGSFQQNKRTQNETDRISTRTKHLLATEIYKSGASMDSDVPWKLLVKVFKGRFRHQILVNLWASLKQSVPGFESATTDRCARYLVEEYEGDSGAIFGGDESDDVSPQRLDAARSSVDVSQARPPRSSPRANKDGGGANPRGEFVPESGPEDEADHSTGAKGANPVNGSDFPSPFIPPPGQSLLGGSDDKASRDTRDGSVDLSTDFQEEPDQGTSMPAKNGGGEIPTTRASRKRATGLVVELGVSRETRKRKKQKKAPTSAPDPDPDPEPEEDERSTNEKPDSALSSNMSDMDDIPARLPVASEDEHLDEEF